MRQAYDDQSPCTRCGSSMEDCDCCAEYELKASMRSLGVRTEPHTYLPYGQARFSYDLASVNRMLREFGY